MVLIYWESIRYKRLVSSPRMFTVINLLPEYTFNRLRPRQNGRHFADDTFNRIFVNENVRISIKFSLKFVPKGPIHNIPALVQIMVWCRPGDKPLSEPMMVSLLTHICVTRPQWVNNQQKDSVTAFSDVIVLTPWPMNKFYKIKHVCRADSRFASSQWETALLCNDVSHWLDASLESAVFAIH